MAKIEKALPSVFGQGRAAHVTTHHPGMPSVYDGLARGLKGFGSDMSEIFNGLIRLGEEGQNLALEQARADYEKEVSERFDAEVFSLNGISAADAGKKAEAILKSARDRQMEKLSAYGMRPERAFSFFATRSGATSLSRAVHHGRTEVRRATREASEQVIGNNIKNYGSTGDANMLAEINEAHDRAWEVSNGRLISAEKLAEFDKNLEGGFVLLNGEKLRVVDKIAPGDKGVIARATAQDLRDRLGRENEMYERSRQNLIDRAHAARIDEFLKWDRLSEAEQHLADEALRAPRERMSQGIRERIATQLGLHCEVLSVRTDAQAASQSALAAGADAYSNGGRYWTPATERAVFEVRKRLSEEARSDERGLAAKKLSLFDAYINAERGARHALEKADYVEQHAQLAKQGLLDPAKLGDLASTLATMPDSPIKDRFVEAYARMRRAVEEKVSNNPEVKKQRRAHVLEFKRHQAAGAPLKFGNRTFDLSKPEELAAATTLAGFTPEEIAEVKAYSTNRRIHQGDAAQIVADALNQANNYTPDPAKGKRYFTAQAVLRLCPEVLDRLEEVAKMYPEIRLDTKDGRAWMREQVIQYLMAMQASKPGWLPEAMESVPAALRVPLLGGALLAYALPGANNSDVGLAEYLSGAIDKKGNIVNADMDFQSFIDLGRTPDQITEELQYAENVRAFAVKSIPRDKGIDHAEAHASRHGMVRVVEHGRIVYRSAATQKRIEEEEKRRGEYTRQEWNERMENFSRSLTNRPLPGAAKGGSDDFSYTINGPLPESLDGGVW